LVNQVLSLPGSVSCVKEITLTFFLSPFLFVNKYSLPTFILPILLSPLSPSNLTPEEVMIKLFNCVRFLITFTTGVAI
jgi:hypothetical protein